MKVINPDDMEARDSGDNPLFEGKVSAKFLFGREVAPDIGMAIVIFEPGARNVFHTHSTGQVLYAIEGEGIVATEGEQVVLKPGMIAYIPAGERHWHGATKNSSFSHIAIAPPHKTEIKNE